MNKQSLTVRRAAMRLRWVNSPQADDMPVATFSRLLMALENCRTHADLDHAAKAWKEAIAKQT